MPDFPPGWDMVISDAVRADPEVSEFLTSDGMLAAESFVANVKGFDEERFELWRVFRSQLVVRQNPIGDE